MIAAVSAAAVAMTMLVSRPGARMRLRMPTTRIAHPRRRLLVAVVVPAVAATLLLGPTALAAMGVLVAVLVVRRMRAGTPVGCATFALTLDVMAGCLAAGASMPAALAAAQVAAPESARESFAAAALALSRGDDPAQTWLQFGADVPELAAVSRLCSRAASTGAAVAAELHRIAAAQRISLDTARRRRLQRASVWLVLPLGLCFLPAFVLVGIVPLVTGVIPATLRGH